MSTLIIIQDGSVTLESLDKTLTTVGNSKDYDVVIKGLPGNGYFSLMLFDR